MSLKKTLFIPFSFLFLTAMCQEKKYHKVYYENGNLKEEGWFEKNKKNGYWKFYYKNGNLQKEGSFQNNKETKYWYFYRINRLKEKEGHFFKGKKNKWWVYYNDTGHVNYKCQLKDNKKNGYCLTYKMKKIIKASKYHKGKKIKEWTDLKSFKRENKMSDLR